MPPQRRSPVYSARAKRKIRGTSEFGRGSRFDNEADAATHEGESLGHYGMPTTVILPLFFLGEPSRLGRRPPACHAGSAKLTSGHSHNHGVLAYSKAAHKGGSFVIHGSLHFQMPKTACVRSSEKRFSVSTITSTSCISLFEPLQTYWPPPKTAYLAGKYRR
jgi:hypothetical protein